MSGHLIYPPTYIEYSNPIIFLAGPIQGAYDWHSIAIDIIQKEAPELNIACPKRNMVKKCGDFSGEMYNEQVDWETNHLRSAGKKGVVLFWLAKEFEKRDDRAYAQTTRFELAEWKVRHERDGSNLVLGIEEGFTNVKYIRRRFAQDCPKVSVLDSLEDTVRKAINLARTQI